MKLIVFIFILFLTLNAKATNLLRIESETFFSIRNDYHQKIESPFYEFFGANYETMDQTLGVDANFSFFADPVKKDQNQFNLYMLNARYELIPERLSMQIGRTADFSKSVGTLISDQLSFKFYGLEKRLAVGVFYGIERDPNLDNQSDLDIKQVGASVGFSTEGKNPYQFSSKLQKEMYRKYSEDYLTLGAHGPLMNLWGSELLFSSEHNITQRSNRRIEAGVDLYPTMNVLNSWRVLTYNTRSFGENNFDPIFSIISRGRLYEVGSILDYRHSSEWSYATSLFFDDYLLQGTRRAQGYRADVDINYFNSFFEGHNKIYYFQSYGGFACGTKIDLVLKAFSFYELTGGGDITYYDKITSAKNMAYNSNLMIGRRFNMYKWLFGAEINRNNFLPYDVRFLTKFIYEGWSRINE